MNRFLLALLLLPVMSFAKSTHQNASKTPANGEVKDEVTKMVDEEYNKEASNVKAEWEKVSKKIADLGNSREKAIADSKAKGAWEAQGAELLQKFQTVITARYHTSTGEFDGGLQLSQRDQENVNKVFSRYLQALPLKGQVSAGEAVRFLEWGNKRLVTLSRTHMDPNEGNNSELEILAAQMKAAESEQSRISGMAKLVGIDFQGTPVGNKPKATTMKFLNERPTPQMAAPMAPPPTAAGGLLPPVQAAENSADAEEPAEAKPLIRAPSSAPKANKKGAGKLLPDF